MDYILETLDSLVHQSAFFNYALSQSYHDRRGRLFSVSCHQKRV